MSKIILLLFFLFFDAQSFIIEGVYDTAHQKLLKSNKIFMVFLTKKDCTHCNKQLMKILESKNVTSLIEKNAVFVLLYKDQKDSFPIEMLYTTQYPTLFFLDKNEIFTCKALRGNIKIKDILTCLKLK